MTAVFVVALAVAGFAQKPDFSGTWTLDPEASGMAGGGAPGGGAPGGGGGGGGRGMAGPMTIKQTADTLTIETTTGRGPVTRTYKLDGSETEIQMGQATAKASAKWDGSKLVITMKTDQGEQTATYSLDGGKLVVETTGGRGPAKRVYKKA
jgi:hypothetical protein